MNSSEPGVIRAILSKARRRHRLNLLLEGLSVALCFGAAGCLLLLLTGTELFDWYWPVLLTTAGLAAGFWRSRSRDLSDYRLAQLLDERLGLADRISTAFYFRSAGKIDQEMMATLERQAAAMTHAGDSARAIPIQTPRLSYAALALTLMCAALMGVRYGLLKTLDLSQPLARIEFNPFADPPEVQASTKKSIVQERLEEQLKQLGLSVDDFPAPEGEAEKPQSETISAVPSPDGQPLAGEKGQSTGEKGESSNDEEGGPGEKGESSSGKPDSEETGDGPAGQQAKSNEQPKNPKQGKPGDQSANVMDKMRDALANLMNKLKINSGEKGQQTASDQQGQQQGNKQMASQKGMQTPGKSQEGQPSPDEQGDREGDADKMQGNQSQAADKSADRPGSPDAKSGMGKQDGSKEIKEAEQLAAMGKISEIFGKRAQQITGEMTIEVPSGKQQLKTAYTDRQTSHSNSGGDVNRDEIPLAYQSYIQRYFEEVRKQAAKSGSTKNGANSAPLAR